MRVPAESKCSSTSPMVTQTSCEAGVGRDGVDHRLGAAIGFHLIELYDGGDGMHVEASAVAVAAVVSVAVAVRVRRGSRSCAARFGRSCAGTRCTRARTRAGDVCACGSGGRRRRDECFGRAGNAVLLAAKSAGTARSSESAAGTAAWAALESSGTTRTENSNQAGAVVCAGEARCDHQKIRATRAVHAAHSADAEQRTAVHVFAGHRCVRTVEAQRAVRARDTGGIARRGEES